jgi:MobC-like protein
MKRKEHSVRSRKFTIRLTPEEFERLQEKARSTTSWDLSEYIRDHLADEPVTVRYRSQSLDEFLPIAIGLKNELNAAGKNFNQAVKKLQSLKDSGDLKMFLQFFEATQFTLNQKIEEIKSILIKSYDLWSQK